MSTYYETGHSKNVANLEDLISYCVGYGATYNPSKTSIKLAGLNTLLTTSKSNIQAVNTTLTAFHNSTNAREIAFEPLRPLGTKILNALIACGASDQTINDFKTLNRKVQGKRAGSKLTKADAGKVINPNLNDPPAEPTDTSISAAQLSYDSYMDHYSKIIALLTTEPLYLPNETALKLPALNTLMTTLTTTNTAVINATTAYSNARIARNKTLYSHRVSWNSDSTLGNSDSVSGFCLPITCQAHLQNAITSPTIQILQKSFASSPPLWQFSQIALGGIRFLSDIWFRN